MYSLNAPVPSAVARLAGDLARDLPAATPRERGTHTLVVKRLGGGDHETFAHLSARARDAVAGAPACRARVDGLGVFPDPPLGTGPVVYLRVESPGLHALHERLCAAIDPVEDIEGEGYTPHVTVARGGDPDAARALTERSVDPVEWAVEELVFWDAERNQRAGTVSLPA